MFGDCLFLRRARCGLFRSFQCRSGLFQGRGFLCQLLVGRRVLTELMAVPGRDGMESVVPSLALLVGATVVMGAVEAFAAHQQRLLSELVGNHTYERIIDVASSVDLASFEDPEFYDRLLRARASALTRPVAMVSSITLIVMSLLTSLGIGFALATMHWLLLVLVLVAAVPLLISPCANVLMLETFSAPTSTTTIVPRSVENQHATRSLRQKSRGMTAAVARLTLKRAPGM